MPAWTLPGLTKFTSDVGKPGRLDDKWATRTNHIWMRQESLELMECYYTSRPSEREYMTCMRELWIDRKLVSTLTETASYSMLQHSE